MRGISPRRKEKFMRLKNTHYVLLKNIRTALQDCGKTEFIAPLDDILSTFWKKREETRMKNRIKAMQRRSQN